MLLFNVSTGCRHIIALFQAHGVFASDENINELLGRTAQLRYYPVKPPSDPLPKGDLALMCHLPEPFNFQDQDYFSTENLALRFGNTPTQPTGTN